MVTRTATGGAPVQHPPAILAPIQVIPPGLLGLLQIKSNGRRPGILADQVQGNIELRDWYMTARRVDNFALFGGAMTTGNVPTASPGGHAFNVAGVPCVVPPGQIWWVEQFSGFGALAAADTIRFNLSITTGSGASFGVSNDYLDTITARARQFEVHIDRGFWAFPGDEFVCQIDDNLTGTNTVVNASLRATPCPL